MRPTQGAVGVRRKKEPSVIACPDSDLGASSVKSPATDCSRALLGKNPHVKNGLSSPIMSYGLSRHLKTRPETLCYALPKKMDHAEEIKNISNLQLVHLFESYPKWYI